MSTKGHLKKLNDDHWAIREATYTFKLSVVAAFEAGVSIRDMAEAIGSREYGEPLVIDALTVYGRLPGTHRHE
jgi:hypothetical protein